MFVKMAKLFANGGEPDQTPQSVASVPDLHCFQVLGFPD